MTDSTNATTVPLMLPHQANRAISIVSPHQDDAALSLTQHILAWTAIGIHVQIVNCFSISNYAPYSNLAGAGTSQVTALRASEDNQYCARVGANTTSVSLNRRDSILRLDTEDLDWVLSRRALDDPNLIEIAHLRRALDRSCEGTHVVVPLGVGSHIDHRIACIASILGLESDIIGFYEELPYAARGDPGEKDQAAKFCSQMAGRRLFRAQYGCQEFRARKGALLSCYASQLSATDIELSTGGPARDEYVWVFEESAAILGSQ